MALFDYVSLDIRLEDTLVREKTIRAHAPVRLGTVRAYVIYYPFCVTIDRFRR